ncbi:hypothetical protein QUI_3626 [Clostridioides difficile P59]|nr:hypothetical protein QUI_3626 [Clostridioides difficile P59]
MRWSDERKDKKCVHKKKRYSAFSKWLCLSWHFPLSCFHFWERWHTQRDLWTTLSTPRTFIPNIRCRIISLISMQIITGRGCRGTGWTGLEKVCNMGFTVLPTLSGR